MRLLHFKLLVFLLSTTAHAQHQLDGFLWPTEASPYLSATFGETRAAHFHSGLDIKTWGREGYRVFASKDGIVHRLSITAKGYGRVIYLKHTDGTYTVYAHLQRFNDKLQSYIDSVRLSKNQFEIDLELDSLRISVTQGDIIGFSGSTGIGPPHLHFEIRDKNERPVNALMSNLSVIDDISPTISSLMIYPLSDSTTINGSKFPRLFYPSKSKKDSLDFGLVSIHGPFGFAISNYDEANDVTNKYAVFEAGIIHNSDTLFYARTDSFDFDESETMFLERLPAIGAYRRSFQTLYSNDGPAIPFHKTRLSSIQPVDSVSDFNIFLNDIYGNKTFANISVENTKIKPASLASHQPLYLGYWTNDWLSLSDSYTIDFKSQPDIPWKPTQNQFLLEIEGKQTLTSRINPHQRFEFTTPDQKLKAHFNQDTFFDTLSVVSYTTLFDSLPYFAIHPATAPVRKDYFVEFYLDSLFQKGQNYRLFWIDRPRDRVSYVPSQLIGRTIHAMPDILGEFVVIPDNDAPTIFSPVLSQTSYGKWIIEVPVIDELSGVDYKKSLIRVNGNLAITEYDFEEDKLIFYHPDFIPNKENRIEVIAYDNAGNSVFQTYQM